MITILGNLLEERLPKEIYDCTVTHLMDTETLEVVRISFPVECCNNSKFNLNVLLSKNNDNRFVSIIVPNLASVNEQNKFSALQLINEANLVLCGQLCIVLEKSNEVRIINEFYSQDSSSLTAYEQIKNYIIYFSPRLKQVLDYLVKVNSLQ